MTPLERLHNELCRTHVTPTPDDHKGHGTGACHRAEVAAMLTPAEAVEYVRAGIWDDEIVALGVEAFTRSTQAGLEHLELAMSEARLEIQAARGIV